MIITALKVFGYFILGSIIFELIVFSIGLIGVLIAHFFGGDKWKNQI